MALALSSTALAFAPAVQPVRPHAASAAAAVRMESLADLDTLSKSLNPKITPERFDPLNLAEADFWGAGEEATIGFLRHAEIKHGRVAMMAFVGYIVQSNGYYFPFQLTTSGITYADISAAGSPPEQWDALPTAAKLQILGAISFLELCGERSDLLEAQGGKHYMMGGKPGVYPSLKDAGVPHPVPFDLFDPFGLSKNASPEKKAKGLLAEINNGRLAMLGIFAFLSEAKVPGSVPALKGLIPPYAGEPMAPFAASDVLPFVKEMSAFQGATGLIQ